MSYVDDSGEVLSCARVSSMLIEKVQRWFTDGPNSSFDSARSQESELNCHPTFLNNTNRIKNSNRKVLSTNQTSDFKRSADVSENQNEYDSPMSSGRTQSAEVISANSTVSLAIANSIIGNLFGPKVSFGKYAAFVHCMSFEYNFVFYVTFMQKFALAMYASLCNIN